MLKDLVKLFVSLVIATTINIGIYYFISDNGAYEIPAALLIAQGFLVALLVSHLLDIVTIRR